MILLATVAPPPMLHGVLNQPAGRALPPNSAPTAGASVISPSLPCDTYVPVVVPAAKSAAVESETVTLPVLKVHVTSMPIVLPLASATAPETVTTNSPLPDRGFVGCRVAAEPE